MNVTTPPASLRGISEEEWKIRCELAALYRLVAYHRMTDLIYTHISARLPGPDHHFLINRYGVMFHEMRASDLVKIDLDGNVIEEDASSKPVNAAGFTIHSAIHMTREDAAYVVHTHTSAGIAVSAQKEGLLPISQHALKFYGHLAYHGYEGVAFREDEKPRLVADMGGANFLMLRNHGLLTCGATIADAFLSMYVFESACQIQIAAQSGGGELTEVNPQILQGVAHAMKVQTDGLGGRFVWPALLRKLDRIDPGYRS